MSGTALELSTEFLTIAVRPTCHAKFVVDYERSELVCISAACEPAYPVKDRIPVLLIGQARDTQ